MDAFYLLLESKTWYALAAYAAVTGMLNLLIAERSRVDAWAESKPRLAAALKLLRGLGFDPWMVIASISLFFRGKLPAPKTSTKSKSPPPAATAMLCLALAFPALTGCSALSSVRPYLAQAAVLASDAINVLDGVEAIAREQFRQFPFPEAEREVMSGIDKCRVALSAATATLHGSEDLDDRKVDEAFAKFKEAYIALEALLSRYGVRPSGGRLGAPGAGGGAVAGFPRPLALAGRQ